jgi:hypothetical protein
MPYLTTPHLHCFAKDLVSQDETEIQWRRKLP